MTKTDVRYGFRFTTLLRNESTFLYNTGPFGALREGITGSSGRPRRTRRARA
jgi:hypothetical protein